MSSTPPASPGASDGLRKRRPTSSEKSKARDAAMIASALAGEAPKLALLVQEHALPALSVMGQAVNVVGPLYLKAFEVGHTVYQTAPFDLGV